MFVSILNHLLNQSPEIRAQNQINAHRCFALRYGKVQKFFSINEQGFLVAGDGLPEAELIFNYPALLKWIKHEALQVDDMTIQGDQEFGMYLLGMVNQLKYYPEGDLVRVLGMEWGSFAYQGFSHIGTHLSEFKNRFVGEMPDYAHEKNMMLIDRANFELWVAQVNQLNDEIACLENRINQLKVVK